MRLLSKCCHMKGNTVYLMEPATAKTYGVRVLTCVTLFILHTHTSNISNSSHFK